MPVFVAIDEAFLSFASFLSCFFPNSLVVILKKKKIASKEKLLFLGVGKRANLRKAEEYDFLTDAVFLFLFILDQI